MSRWGLRNLEFAGVPRELVGYARGLLCELVEALRADPGIDADRSIGGALVGAAQVALHFCTFRLVRRDDEPRDREFLRVVDLHEPATAGFPKRLFAAHLLALAEQARWSVRRLALLRRAVQIHPGDLDVRPFAAATAAANPGNFYGWCALGDAHCDRGAWAAGLDGLRTAVARWPAGGVQQAQSFAAAISAGRRSAADPRAAFWRGVAGQTGSGMRP